MYNMETLRIKHFIINDMNVFMSDDIPQLFSKSDSYSIAYTEMANQLDRLLPQKYQDLTRVKVEFTPTEVHKLH